MCTQWDYQCISNSQIIHFTHTHTKIHDKVDGQKITEDALKLKIVWWFPAIVYKFSHVIHFKHGRYTYWKIIQKSSEFGPRRSNDWNQYWTHITLCRHIGQLLLIRLRVGYLLLRRQVSVAVRPANQGVDCWSEKLKTKKRVQSGECGPDKCPI